MWKCSESYIFFFKNKDSHKRERLSSFQEKVEFFRSIKKKLNIIFEYQYNRCIGIVLKGSYVNKKVLVQAMGAV